MFLVSSVETTGTRLIMLFVFRLMKLFAVYVSTATPKSQSLFLSFSFFLGPMNV